MRKLIVLPFLMVIFLMTGLTSCMDSEDPAYIFSGEPALVKSIEGIPVLSTAYGEFSVPDLAGKSVSKGDYLWTSFTVDMNGQPSTGVMNATNFQYQKIDTANVTVTNEDQEYDSYLNSQEYPDSMRTAVLYKSYIGDVLFFGFEQLGTSGQQFSYQLICEPKPTDPNGYYTLTLLSRKMESGTNSGSSKGLVVSHFGFNMASFLSKEDVSQTNPVRFNVRYKIGTKDGKNVYKEFITKPISW